MLHTELNCKIINFLFVSLLGLTEFFPLGKAEVLQVLYRSDSILDVIIYDKRYINVLIQIEM